MDALNNLCVAIAHDYVTQRGGAERVVLAMLRAFPNATLYTMLYDPETSYPEFRNVPIRTSRLNALTLARSHHRAALPVLALAATSIKIDADVVICSSSGWAHGFRGGRRRIVYCYSPARWLYEPELYLGRGGSRLARIGLALLTRPLKAWDKRAARRNDEYLSISSVVQNRVQRTYGRASRVLPAPVTFDPDGPEEPVATGVTDGPFFVCVSRLLPYKRVDVAVDAFAHTGRRLVIVGDGPEKEALRQRSSENVVIVSSLTDAQLRWLYRRCSGLISASYEDFGLTPLEAASFGRPCVVPREGGFLDTVIHGETGILYDDVTPEGLRKALDDFENRSWDAQAIRAHSRAFSEDAFAGRLRAAVADIAVTGKAG